MKYPHRNVLGWRCGFDRNGHLQFAPEVLARMRKDLRRWKGSGAKKSVTLDSTIAAKRL